MKNFTSKGFMHKLIISIVCVILLNFCIAPVSQASFGGKMMSLIVEFATAIADVAATVVQLGLTGEWHYAVAENSSGIPDDDSGYWVKSGKFNYPVLQVSPELIFANKIELLDANFVTGGNTNKNYLVELEDESALNKLRSIIASWYVTFRTIAIVGLLSVLIYMGIRIIISSTSGEKAKYKERLMDWIIAFCLLFFMHYIMAAAVTVVDKVNDVLGDIAKVEEGIPIPDDFPDVQQDVNDSYSGVRQSFDLNLGLGSVNGLPEDQIDAYISEAVYNTYGTTPSVGSYNLTKRENVGNGMHYDYFDKIFSWSYLETPYTLTLTKTHHYSDDRSIDELSYSCGSAVAR